MMHAGRPCAGGRFNRYLIQKGTSMPIFKLSFAFLLALAFGTLHAQETAMPDAQKLFDKDTVTILVTDSGLGGLAVAADVESRVRTSHLYRTVRIIFCNALAEKNYGYNSMKTREEKIRVFSSALTGMASWYTPDIILIACNTLSVLYAETEFSKTTTIPVAGIVETGVDLMAERLQADPSSIALIMGTPTTITAAKHREGLIKKGIAPERIVLQACKDLESEIQADPAGSRTRTLIDTYITQAMTALPGTARPIVAGLCCTHYGYSLGLIESSLKGHTAAPFTVIDPNARMADFLFPEGKKGTVESPACDVTVVSRTVVTQEEKDSLGDLLARVSPATAAALRSFVHKRDLFEFTPAHE